MALRSPNVRVVTAVLLIAGAVVVNLAFTLLGTSFDYPDVLQHPATEVLARFHADALTIGSEFTLLAAGAALLAPIAVLTARLAGRTRLARAAAVTGVAAAAVQVIGLSRWPLFVPGLASTVTDPAAGASRHADALAEFRLLHTVLGTVVGESLGYLLTATWTVLVVVALHRAGVIGRASAALGLLSAPLILAGLLVPAGVPAADLANFAGYVVWSLWFVVTGILLLLPRRAVPVVVATA